MTTAAHAGRAALVTRSLAIAFLFPGVTAEVGAEQLRARAEALHRGAIVVDGHNDVATWIRDPPS